MHNEKHPPNKLDQGLTDKTYNDLDQAQMAGRNIRYGTDAGIDPAVNKMRQNLYRFSMAKTLTEQEAISELMAKEDGTKRSWQEFKEEVLKLNSEYNINYLQAEWQTARQAGHHARNWEQYQKQKHLFPNLKYQTVGDERVRDEHAVLEGIIAPIDHPFWDKYYPPNGWRCRCGVVQTAEKASEHIPETATGIKPEFQINVGKTAQAFSDGRHAKAHPYFQLPRSSKELEKIFEMGKTHAPYNSVKTPKGNTVKVSIFADQRPDELPLNLEIAKLLTDKVGLKIKLPAHLDGKIVKNHKNPEYLIGEGTKADRKSPVGKKYKNILSKANAQECEVVIIDLSNNKDTTENALHKVNDILKNNVHTFIKEVYIISADKKEVKHYKRK